MSDIRVEDIEMLAEMAQLVLTDEEKETYTEQIRSVVEVAEKLTELDTSDVPETAYGVELENVLRPDENRPSLPREAVLQNAPDPKDGFFKVPRVIE